MRVLDIRRVEGKDMKKVHALLDSSSWEQRQKVAFQSSSTHLQQVVDVGTKKGYDFDALSMDFFSSFYQFNPKFPSQESEGPAWQKTMLNELQQLREYKDLRKAGTVCDGFQAGLAATVVAEHFSKELPKMDEPDPTDVQNQINMYEDAMQDFFSGAGAADSSNAKKFEDRIQELKEQLKKSNEAWKALDKDPQAWRSMLRGALQEAQAAVNEGTDTVSAFGYGTETGSDGYTSVTTKLAIAEQVKKNQKLQEIAALAGRFRAEARQMQAQKKSPGFTELTEIEIGADIGRLIPAELVKLTDDFLELEFGKKLLERGLIQYKLETVEKKVRGPIIMCLDDSGSMSGTNEVWSKAIALAMCQIAVDQHRTFEVIHFDSSVRNKLVCPNGKVDPAKLLESMAYFSGGGTDFVKPLGEAFGDVVDAAKSDLREANVVFITDGHADIPQKNLETINLAKKHTGAGLFTICLGNATNPQLQSISDMAVNLSLSDDSSVDSVKETLFSI